MKKRAVLLLIVLVILGTAGFATSAEARTRHPSTHRTTTIKPVTPPTITPPIPATTPVTPPATTTTPPVTPPVTLPVTPPATTAVPVVPPAPTPSPTAGRWFGFYVPGAPSSMTPIDSLDSKLGARASVVNFFVSDSEAFPAPRCNNIVASGATPLITLEFWSIQNSGGLAAINNGSKDAYIKSFADNAKAFGKPIWLRPFHEMNGNWYPWGTTGSNTPAQLMAAYRHVHDIFAAEGATNVKFVWCPNVDFNVSSFYPGDAYVDYAAIDGYNNGSPWRTFSNLFGTTYASVAAVSTRPIFLAETSCVEGGNGKAAWITDMFSQISTKYTRIVGVCWFDASLTYDWRVDTSASSLSAFSAGVTKGF